MDRTTGAIVAVAGTIVPIASLEWERARTKALPPRPLQELLDQDAREVQVIEKDEVVDEEQEHRLHERPGQAQHGAGEARLELPLHARQHEVAVRGPGDVVGELAALDEG